VVPEDEEEDARILSQGSQHSMNHRISITPKKGKHELFLGRRNSWSLEEDDIIRKVPSSTIPMEDTGSRNHSITVENAKSLLLFTSNDTTDEDSDKDDDDECLTELQTMLADAERVLMIAAREEGGQGDDLFTPAQDNKSSSNILMNPQDGNTNTTTTTTFTTTNARTTKTTNTETRRNKYKNEQNDGEVLAPPIGTKSLAIIRAIIDFLQLNHDGDDDNNCTTHDIDIDSYRSPEGPRDNTTTSSSNVISQSTTFLFLFKKLFFGSNKKTYFYGSAFWIPIMATTTTCAVSAIMDYNSSSSSNSSSINKNNKKEIVTFGGLFSTITKTKTKTTTTTRGGSLIWIEL